MRSTAYFSFTNIRCCHSVLTETKLFAMIMDRNDALSHNKRYNSCFEFKQKMLCLAFKHWCSIFTYHSVLSFVKTHMLT